MYSLGKDHFIQMLREAEGHVTATLNDIVGDRTHDHSYLIFLFIRFDKRKAV